MICVGSGHVVDCKGVSICWDKAMDNEVSFAASLHVCPMVLLRDARARFFDLCCGLESPLISWAVATVVRHLFY